MRIGLIGIETNDYRITEKGAKLNQKMKIKT